MNDAKRIRGSILGPEQLALIAVGIALNLGLGFVVSALKLPFYLDSIGTVLATALGGLGVGVIVGVLSVIIGSLYVPTLWAYVFTAVAIAIYTNITLKIGFLRRLVPTLLGGIGLGVIAAIFSAPVTTYVWKGVSLAGPDAITAFVLTTGKTILESVVLGGLATDPIDKIVTSLIAYALLRRIPSSMKLRPDAP